MSNILRSDYLWLSEGVGKIIAVPKGAKYMFVRVFPTEIYMQQDNAASDVNAQLRITDFGDDNSRNSRLLNKHNGFTDEFLIPIAPNMSLYENKEISFACSKLTGAVWPGAMTPKFTVEIFWYSDFSLSSTKSY